MTNITKAARIQAVAAILKQTFAPRITDLASRIQDDIAAQAKQLWPEFYKLRANKAAREFVPTKGSFSLNYEAGRGSWGENFDLRIDFVEFTKNSMKGAYYLAATTVEIPCYKDSPLVAKDSPLVSEYKALQQAMDEARLELLQAFDAYTKVEKMQEELPDLAKFLPLAAPVKSTSVAVKPEDVMAKLAKLGIPPKTARR